MPVFSYEAVDGEGRASRGTLTADSPRHARDQLRAKSLRARSVSERAATGRLAGLLARAGAGPRRPAAAVAAVARDMATMLEAGVPLLDAFDSLVKQQAGAMEVSLLRLRDRVAAGTSLSEAMAGQPAVYSPLVVQMVRVGEGAGTLGRTLDQLADFLEQSGRLKDRVLNALTYPAFVLAASLAVTLFLMTAVVPMLLEGLVEAGRPIPLPTRVLKFLSDLLLDHGWLLAGASTVGLAAAAAFLRSERGRRAAQAAVLRLPLVGEMSRKQAVSRASMMIGHLMAAGMDFVPAVRITAESLDHAPLREALEAGVRDVQAGESITRSLSRSTLFSPVALRIFSVGQESGRLDEMLIRLGEAYDRQVATLASRLASLIEPALILSLSVVVGFILFATIIPILEAGRVL